MCNPTFRHQTTNITKHSHNKLLAVVAMPIRRIVVIISSRLNSINLDNTNPTRTVVVDEALSKAIRPHSNTLININSLVTSTPMLSPAVDEADEEHLPVMVHLRSSDANCTNQQRRHKYNSHRANISTLLPQKRFPLLR